MVPSRVRDHEQVARSRIGDRRPEITRERVKGEEQVVCSASSPTQLGHVFSFWGGIMST
jgi:hypothetical protein